MQRPIAPYLCLLLTFTAACGRSAAEAMPPQAPVSGLGGMRAESAEETMAVPASAPADVSMTAMAAPAMAAAPAPAAVPAAPAPPMAPAPRSQTSAPPMKAPSAPAPKSAKTIDAPVDASRAPLVIYTGALEMMADEDRFASTIDKAIDVAESVGGYLAARKDASVQVRVPSAHFREALTKLEELGSVVHRSVNASDVSEDVHDGEVRLQNLRATRARLQEFLTKAPNVPETLMVERELERVAQEIDVLEGRLQFLKARAAYSQIDVALSPKPKTAPRIAGDPPRKYVELPVSWLDELGVDRLTTIR